MYRRTYSTNMRDILSAERMSRYGSATGAHTATVLGNYFWNVALCEALYPSLHCVEVALRNGIHNAATAEFGNPAWFMMATPVLVSERFRRGDPTPYPAEQQDIDKAIQKFLDDGRIPVPGDVVAKMDFGFWDALFKREYRSILWTRPGFMAAVFPAFVPGRDPITQLSGRFSAIRIFRNRVFHHEPIFHRTDLANQHAQIIEAIGWLSPAMHLTLTTGGFDNFPAVLGRGSAHYESLMSALMATMP